MAWIYLAELVGSALLSNHGSDQSPIVSLIDTARVSYCPECDRATLHPHRSTTTCEISMNGCLDMQDPKSSSAVSHVRTSALLDLERAWTESEAVYFSKSSDYVAIFDQDSFSWKTSQLSLIEDLNAFSWSSLRFGMIVAGRLYQPANLELRTCAKDGGYLPTPTARDFKSPGVSRTRRAHLEDRRGIPLSQYFKLTFGANLHPSFVEWMMGYPQKHTACGPLEIQWFRSKRAKRSKDLQDCEATA